MRSLGWLEDVSQEAVIRRRLEPPVYQDKRITCPRCSWRRRQSGRALARYRKHWHRHHR